jgi:hypothetical protein
LAFVGAERTRVRRLSELSGGGYNEIQEHDDENVDQASVLKISGAQVRDGLRGTVGHFRSGEFRAGGIQTQLLASRSALPLANPANGRDCQIALRSPVGALDSLSDPPEKIFCGRFAQRIR